MNMREILENLSQDLQNVNAPVQTHKQIQNIVFSYMKKVKAHEEEQQKMKDHNSEEEE